jgi:hypothetical protein
VLALRFAKRLNFILKGIKMALKLPSRTETLKCVVRADSSLLWSGDPITDDETWAAYLKSGDESLLRFKDGEQPTRFVLRKVLSFDQNARVQNAQTTMKDGQIQIQMSFIQEDVRQALVDIENPDYVPLPDRIQYKRDSDGSCSKEIVEGLQAIGAVMDLFTIRQNATSKFTEDLKKK